jgi:Ser/Thr protein kinase RdoA (MazF antagonist)
MNAAAFAALAPEQQMERLTDLARTALARYGLPPETRVKLLTLSENATFLVQNETTGWKSILRVHRPGYHTEKAIRSELAWLKALNGHSKVFAAQPIPGRDGDDLYALEHASVPEPRYAAMFEFLPGQEPDPSDLGSFEQLGAVTAHLHEHVQTWPEASTLSRHTWDLDSMFFRPKPLWGRWQDGLGVRGERAALLDKLAEHLRDRLSWYGKTSENFGLIHADLRLTNLLINNDRVQVIDFDDCGFSWFIYDLASALSFIEEQPQVPDLIRAWVRGYRSVRPLSETDEAEIPTFVMARRLLLTAWVGSHQEAPFPRQLGEAFTVTTCELAKRLLAERGLL